MDRKEIELWLDLFARAVRIGADDAANEMRRIILEAVAATTIEQNAGTIEAFQRQDGATLYAIQKGQSDAI